MKTMYGMITNPGADWLFRDSRKKKSPPLFSAEEIDRMDPASFRGMSRPELAALRSWLEAFQEDFFAPDDCEVDSPAWKEWERLDDKLDELINCLEEMTQ